MNLQLDLLCCSDFSFTNTTSCNPSLHKRKREHGSHRAQHAFLSDPTSDQPFAHCEPVSASAPKHWRRKEGMTAPQRVRWDKAHKRSTTRTGARSPGGGAASFSSLVPGSRGTVPELEPLGQAKGTHDQVSKLTKERPGSKSTENGPSFTLERICPVYFTLIYICTGNNKKAIYYTTIQ